MSDLIWFYLSMTLLCLFLQGMFAMLEMACVSFNRIRLQYYLSQGSRRAKWLSYLIERPAWVFGTTLIGVNGTMIIGSECSRRLYEACGISPDLAPVTQILSVLLFAEISPMLAGRRYAEHVGLLGAPILFFLSFLFRPVIYALDLLCRLVNVSIGAKVPRGSYLSREDLQNLIEEREEVITSDPSKQEIQTIVPSLFSCRGKSAKDLMEPLTKVPVISIFATVKEIRTLLQANTAPFVALYHKNPHNIVQIVFPRDLLRQADHAKVKAYAKAPWFITESASILQILKQFRSNNQNVAVVLNATGLATGILSLDAITDEIFGFPVDRHPPQEVQAIFIERTFPADFLLEQFNQQFHSHLHYKDAKTLGEVMCLVLGHMPTRGEVVRIDAFELIVEEASLLAPKSILVRTL